MSNVLASSEVKIMVADCCELFATALAAHLTGLSTIGQYRVKVVKIAFSLDEMLEGITQYSPHLIILEDRLDMDASADVVLARGLEVARSSGVMFLKWILIGSFFYPGMVREMMDAGCNGFLYRGDHLGLILKDSIGDVLRNKAYVSPRANAEDVRLSKMSRVAGGIVLGAPLSREEQNVLDMLVKNCTSSQIRLTLNLTQDRFYRVRHHLKTKLGAATNEGLIAAAFDKGYIVRGPGFPMDLTEMTT